MQQGVVEIDHVLFFIMYGTDSFHYPLEGTARNPEWVSGHPVSTREWKSLRV